MIAWEIMEYSHCSYSTDYVFQQKYCVMEFRTHTHKHTQSNRTQG